MDASATRILDLSQRRSDVGARAGANAGQPGLVGSAVDLSGGASLRGPAVDLHSQELTLGAWIQLDAATGQHTVLSKADAPGNVLYELRVDGTTGEAVATLRLSGSAVVARGGSVTPATWAAIDAVWDGSELTLMVDGTVADVVPAVGQLATDPSTKLSIGSRSDTSNSFDGRIDHVIVRHGTVSSAEVNARNTLATNPASSITVGAEQTALPQPWTVGGTQTRSGGFALQAPESPDSGTAAWAVATGIDEPGVVFESYWWVSTDTAIDLSAGTRATAIPTDQFEAALTGPSGWQLRQRTGASETTDAGPQGTLNTGTWVKVEIWTDQLGDTRLLIDGVEVTGWTSQGTAIESGSVALRTGQLPSGEDWYVDDARARKLVTPEPVASLGPLDRD